jgi:hypothetical protein
VERQLPVEMTCYDAARTVLRPEHPSCADSVIPVTWPERWEGSRGTGHLLTFAFG